MAKRSWRIWGLGILFLSVVAWILLYPSQQTGWIGETDLVIEFIVADALNGTPIPNSLIHVYSQGGNCDETIHQFSFRTDADGRAKRSLRACQCHGTSGRFNSTFVVPLPNWVYKVQSNGYEMTPPTELNRLENVRKVKKGPTAAILVVLVNLHPAK
jgi:hypothetical protein